MVVLSAINKMKTMWKRFSDKDYRRSYLDGAINDRLAAQIFSLRIARGLTQAEAAAMIGIAQPTLSKYEADCAGITTTTLKKIAAAYDVALIVRFATFGEFVRDVARGRIDRNISSYEKDTVIPVSYTITTRALTAPSILKVARVQDFARNSTVVNVLATKGEQTRSMEYVDARN